MELWDIARLGAAAVATVALVESLHCSRRAETIKTLDKFAEAWELLYRSRLALLVAFLSALASLAAAYRL
jgi:hypothetical protein